MSSLAEKDATVPAEDGLCVHVGRTEATETGDVRPQDMTRALVEGTGGRADRSKGKAAPSKQRVAESVNRRTQLRSHAS